MLLMKDLQFDRAGRSQELTISAGVVSYWVCCRMHYPVADEHGKSDAPYMLYWVISEGGAVVSPMLREDAMHRYVASRAFREVLPTTRT